MGCTTYSPLLTLLTLLALLCYQLGAALSIEGAYLLGQQLSATHLGVHGRGGESPGELPLRELQAAFAAYQAAHQVVVCDGM